MDEQKYHYKFSLSSLELGLDDYDEYSHFRNVITAQYSKEPEAMEKLMSGLSEGSRN